MIVHLFYRIILLSKEKVFLETHVSLIIAKKKKSSSIKHKISFFGTYLEINFLKFQNPKDRASGVMPFFNF